MTEHLQKAVNKKTLPKQLLILGLVALPLLFVLVKSGVIGYTSASVAAVEASTVSETKTKWKLKSSKSKPNKVELESHKIIVDRQIENFRNGTGVLINFHITHHAGTTVCREFGLNLKHPSFACLGPKPEDGVNLTTLYPRKRPWGYNETDRKIKIVRQYFRFISWEFRIPPKADQYPQIKDTDWENEDIVSMIVMREPISRSLAGDGGMLKKYAWWGLKGPSKNATVDNWWEFARNEKTHNNNFALRILSDYTCCNGSDTDRQYLEDAKDLMRRFTFVVDMACLDESMDKISDLLGFELRHHDASTRKSHRHKALSERIPYPEVLSYLEEKNKLDIELYEWSKSLSIVNCQALEDERTAVESRNGDGVL